MPAPLLLNKMIGRLTFGARLMRDAPVDQPPHPTHALDFHATKKAPLWNPASTNGLPQPGQTPPCRHHGRSSVWDGERARVSPSIGRCYAHLSPMLADTHQEAGHLRRATGTERVR